MYKKYMECFHYNEAIFKDKMEELVSNLKLILNKHINYRDICLPKLYENRYSDFMAMIIRGDGPDIYLSESSDLSEPEFDHVHKTSFKIFNFDIEDKETIISYFTNNGFIYVPTPKMKDRLIFKYVTTVLE